MNAVIDKVVQSGTNFRVGHASIVGYGMGSSPVIIGNNVQIGAFCVIHKGAVIGDDVDIDHYCRIGADVVVGHETKVLYGAQLFNHSRVGRHCIIGGDLSERVLVEDNVTFMGAIAHWHRNPNLDWDTTDEPSPIFEAGCVVGVQALIVGGIRIGSQSYIGAREIVRTDVPPRTVVVNGRWFPLEEWRGFVKSRSLPD